MHLQLLSICHNHFRIMINIWGGCGLPLSIFEMCPSEDFRLKKAHRFGRYCRKKDKHSQVMRFVPAILQFESSRSQVQWPPNGGVSNGGVSRSGLVLPFLSFWDFRDVSGIFPICSGMVRGFSRFVPFLFLGLFRAPTRNSPERVCDTIWTFSEKSGKRPGLETPRFSFSQQVRSEKTA